MPGGTPQPQTWPPPAPAGDAPGSILGPQSALDRFIAKQEGFRPTAYWDYKQYSIGHGTRGRPGETISREEAGQRLQSEIANARQSVDDFAPDAPPGVKDALTSLTFNAGSGWQQSGLGRLIREGRYDEARDRFQQYIKAGGTPLPGLVSRRQAELSNFWDQPQQDGRSNVQLASYAPSGGAGGAPIPGMGGAGSPRLQPQVPPLEGPPPSPGEQVTPTDIEPMPSTAQFGGRERFVRTDAPRPGVPPAAALPPDRVEGRLPSAPLPPVVPPPGPPQGPSAQVPIPEPPGFRQQLVRPTPPLYPDQPSEYELRAQRAITANPGDEVIKQQADALAAFGKAQRDAAYQRQVQEYVKNLELYNAKEVSRERYYLDLPKSQQELRKGEAELKEIEQRTSQGQLSTGVPPVPAAPDPRLGTPISPQRTGVPSVGPVPAGVSPQKWGEIQAPEIAKKIETADKASADTVTLLDRINQARNHPGINSGLGLQGDVMGKIKGTEAYGFHQLVGEIKGSAFLQAYTGMKGTGAITEKEGEKATQAKERIQTAQSPKDFQKALLDYENAVRGDLERVQRGMNRPVTAWRQPGDNSSFAPDIGQVDPRYPGYHYVGGNPAEPASWARR